LCRYEADIPYLERSQFGIAVQTAVFGGVADVEGRAGGLLGFFRRLLLLLPRTHDFWTPAAWAHMEAVMQSREQAVFCAKYVSGTLRLRPWEARLLSLGAHGAALGVRGIVLAKSLLPASVTAFHPPRLVDGMPAPTPLSDVDATFEGAAPAAVPVKVPVTVPVTVPVPVPVPVPVTVHVKVPVTVTVPVPVPPASVFVSTPPSQQHAPSAVDSDPDSSDDNSGLRRASLRWHSLCVASIGGAVASAASPSTGHGNSRQSASSQPSSRDGHSESRHTRGCPQACGGTEARPGRLTLPVPSFTPACVVAPTARLYRDVADAGGCRFDDAPVAAPRDVFRPPCTLALRREAPSSLLLRSTRGMARAAGTRHVAAGVGVVVLAWVAHQL
jgi:hypothetical protein